MEQLWNRTRILLYPPPAEHFGIVPLEAMARGIPVVAVDAGGPRETVLSGTTGLLTSAAPTVMGEALRQIWFDEKGYPLMSANARQRANENFGMNHFDTAIQKQAQRLLGH